MVRALHGECCVEDASAEERDRRMAEWAKGERLIGAGAVEEHRQHHVGGLLGRHGLGHGQPQRPLDECAEHLEQRVARYVVAEHTVADAPRKDLPHRLVDALFRRRVVILVYLTDQRGVLGCGAQKNSREPCDRAVRRKLIEACGIDRVPGAR